MSGGRSVSLTAIAHPREAILHALGDPISRELLLLLNQTPRRASDLLRAGAIPPSTLYRKLGRLRKLGLVAVQRSIVTEDGKRLDLYRSLLCEVDVSLRGATLEVRAQRRNLSAERLADLWEDVREAGDR